ncbi:glutamate receptor U1 precursor, putative [Pediculus humanus corporis]|uniref:Glutamate receptor U1, putative n=1 Tax=Pediculus humanus subsp. corporis TaxID=121224 RepID=E0VBK7_PEDHC|nr:glutamate receptor U1 precursor, putative [Pediculus humanus corporis]EEB10763.1 glutamate receptor U1 precursor, putative [Pediculus humanus corporis]
MFSKKKIQFNYYDLNNFNDFNNFSFDIFQWKLLKIGIIVDLKCPRSMTFLQKASEKNLFIYEFAPIHWLIFTNNHVTRKQLITMDDNNPLDFLMESYDDKKFENELFVINKKVNFDFFFNETEKGEKGKNNNNNNRKVKLNVNETDINQILHLTLLLDNKVTLSVPGFDNITSRSNPKIDENGIVFYEKNDDCLFKINDTIIRKNFMGSLIRAGATAFQPKAFTTIDDVSSREVDVWAKMVYEHVKILEQDLNFRSIIRYFNDVGYIKNGSFGHLMGSIQEKKSEISATGVLLRSDRFGIVDYIICPFRLGVGLVFKEPSLPTVKNIFILPFTGTVWISIGILFIIIIIFMRLREIIIKKFLFKKMKLRNISELCMQILGAICQQGLTENSKWTSDRVIISFLLLTALILYFAYSASIVTFLQSSSSAISTIEDVTSSNLEVGVQAHFPYLDVLMKEASHRITKEYYKKKIFNKGRENVYFEQREGINKIRTGLFAFEIELNAGYKLISQTFKDHEKCGIKEILLVPKPFVCMAVSKTSSYREIFAQRLVWQQETGMFDRTIKKWSDEKPKCNMDRATFISVGYNEINSIFIIFLYGLIISIIIFFLEIFLFKINNMSRKKTA